MKVALLGDIHTDLDYLDAALSVAKQAGAEAMIQLGDFGFDFNHTFQAELDTVTHKYHMPLYVVRGNHDRPEWFAQYYRSGYVNYISDGTVVVIGTKRLAFLGGGVSIDRSSRQPYVSWWPDERVNYSVAIEWFVNDTKADILISHDCPIQTRIAGIGGLPEDIQHDCNTDRAIVSYAAAVLEVDTIYHGHWHKRNTDNVSIVNKKVLVEGMASNHENLIDSLIIVEF